MSPTKNSESIKQVTYLATALKAPRIVEAAERLADQARNAAWTHEDYLAAVLEREVSARNASGANQRIRAGVGRVLVRGSQHRAPRSARHRQDTSRDRARRDRGTPRTTRALRHRGR